MMSSSLSSSVFNSEDAVRCLSCNSWVSLDRAGGVHGRINEKNRKLRTKNVHAFHPSCLITHFLEAKSNLVKCPSSGCRESIQKNEVKKCNQMIEKRSNRWMVGICAGGLALSYAVRMGMTPGKAGLSETVVESIIGFTGATVFGFVGCTGRLDVVSDGVVTLAAKVALSLIAGEIIGRGGGTLASVALILVGEEFKERRQIGRDTLTMMIVTSGFSSLLAEMATLLKVVEIPGMIFGMISSAAVLGKLVGRRFSDLSERLKNT